MIKEIIKKKTAHGGDYYVFCYLNSKGEGVDKSVAEYCRVLELKNDGTRVYETNGVVNRDKE